MKTMDLDKEEIVSLTEKYGGQWGINHTRRLLELVSMIGEGQEYNRQAVWIAAHLHDWGAYAPWPHEGVDHALRSRQVAEVFLGEWGVSQELKDLILECIERHHSGCPDNSIEAILLSDADALDFLGVVGVLRDFSKNPKDMRKAYETTRKRQEKLPAKLVLDRSKKIAARRLQQMDDLLCAFEEDSFGCF